MLNFWPFKRKLKPLPERPPVPLPKGPSKIVVIKGKVVNIEVDGFENFTEEEKQFYIQSLNLMLEVIGSREFYDQAMAMKVTETLGLTLDQAYNLVLSGYDAYGKVVDHAFNFFFSLFYDSSRTIGYSNPGQSEEIHTNRAFLSEWMKAPLTGPAYLAGHIFHEYLHVCGFFHVHAHAGTMVYEWGYLARNLGLEVLGGRKLEERVESKFEGFLGVIEA